MEYLLAILMFSILLYGWLRGHWFFTVLMALCLGIIGLLATGDGGPQSLGLVAGVGVACMPRLWRWALHRYPFY